MSPITRTHTVSMIMVFLAGVLVLASCGSPNSTAKYDPETGAHPSDWLPAVHAGAAQTDNAESCKDCHGADLLGGISKVSCIQCHLGGPLAVHPAAFGGLSWFQSGATTQGHGLYVIQNGITSCENEWCHGTSLGGVSQSGPACSTCHPGEAF